MEKGYPSYLRSLWALFFTQLRMCDNLPEMAQGADVLVHEVIDPVFIDHLFPEDRTDAQEALRHHLPTAHTTIEDVGKVATASGLETLALNHIVPGNAAAGRLEQARRNFRGKLIVGEDLPQIGVKWEAGGSPAGRINPVTQTRERDGWQRVRARGDSALLFQLCLEAKVIAQAKALGADVGPRGDARGTEIRS